MGQSLRRIRRNQQAIVGGGTKQQSKGEEKPAENDGGGGEEEEAGTSSSDRKVLAEKSNNQKVKTNIKIDPKWWICGGVPWPHSPHFFCLPKCVRCARMLGEGGGIWG